MNRLGFLLGAIGGVVSSPEPPSLGNTSAFKIKDINKDISPEALQQLNDYFSTINPLNVSMHNVRGFLTTGAMIVVARQELTAAGTFDFQAIPANFKHLKLLAYARGDNAAIAASVLLRYNGDSGSNYYTQFIDSVDAAAVTGGTSGPTSSANVGDVPAATADAGFFGAIEVTIPFYSSGNRKSHLAQGYNLETKSPNFQSLFVRGSSWDNTAVINRIQLFSGIGSFTAGSICTLYAQN